MHDVPDTVSTLAELLEASRDGEYGFRACAEHVRAARLRVMFESRAAEWRAAAAQLQAHLQEMGGAPDLIAPPAGSVHRGWVAPRSELREQSDHAMLVQCERGEKAAVETYADALSEELPPRIRRLVEQQYEGVRRNHAQLRRWLDTKLA